MSSSAVQLKRMAAEAALEHVRSGSVVGLGTGSTAAFVTSGLAERLADGRLTDVRAVPTSKDTAERASSAGIELVELQPGGIDLAIDGCDEVDDDLRLIKGLGGAMTREKLVASEARRFLVVADDTKHVARLGMKAPVPVEVLPFGLAATAARVSGLGQSCVLRLTASGTPLETDNGNLVLDLVPHEGFVPEELDRALKQLTGVVEHGLFLGLATGAILAGPSGLRLVGEA